MATKEGSSRHDSEAARRWLVDLGTRDPFRFQEAVLYCRFAPGPEGLRLLLGVEVTELGRSRFLAGGRPLRYGRIERIDLGGRIAFRAGQTPRWDVDYLKEMVPIGAGISARSWANAP